MKMPTNMQEATQLFYEVRGVVAKKISEVCAKYVPAEPINEPPKKPEESVKTSETQAQPKKPEEPPQA